LLGTVASYCVFCKLKFLTFANKVGRSWRILRSEVDNFLLREKVGAYQMSINQTNKK